MIPKFFLIFFKIFYVLITEIKESNTLKSKKKLIDQINKYFIKVKTNKV